MNIIIHVLKNLMSLYSDKNGLFTALHSVFKVVAKTEKFLEFETKGFTKVSQTNLSFKVLMHIKKFSLLSSIFSCMYCRHWIIRFTT